MLTENKIRKLAESTSNNPDEAEWTLEFARLVEAEALRSVARSWGVKLSDSTTRVDVRRIHAHAKQAAKAAKEGR
jgi:hypothetical protein